MHAEIPEFDEELEDEPHILIRIEIGPQLFDAIWWTLFVILAIAVFA